MTSETTWTRAAKPVLKWAGGKTQMLPVLSEKIPMSFEKYIEPFFGGGALFFNLQPKRAVVADSNPELVNLYRALRNAADEVIDALARFRNEEDLYYEVRAQDWQAMTSVDAAARTIYLNRTCFNGLYRVNRAGVFNTPFGHYKSPRIVNEEALRSAGRALQNADIRLGDYAEILIDAAQPGDLVFLDPPYVPLDGFADFKRYTKEQFHIADHVKLADTFRQLDVLGCNLILTNSNHPLTHELYRDFRIEIIPTRRNINSNGKKRTGEDIIVTNFDV